jgi:hypothetical protein
MGVLPQAAAVVIAPSPPAGEGSEALPHMMMGEGGGPLGLIPSPIRHCCTFVLPSPAGGEGTFTGAQLAAALSRIVRAT